MTTSSSEKRDPCQSPPISFGTFIMSLAQTALVHLGELDHPESGSPKPDPDMAKQTIDLLELLECKTRGNLEEDETRMLSAVLYDLRVKYVDLQKEPDQG